LWRPRHTAAETSNSCIIFFYDRSNNVEPLEIIMLTAGE
jgi:hypothetical protein